MVASGIEILILCILVAAAATFFYYRRQARHTASINEPACGSCRYPVRGLEAMTCPECGTDLREAGIITPTASTNPLGRLPSKIIIFTTITALVGFLTLPLLMHTLPKQQSATRSVTFGSPTSATYQQIEAKRASHTTTWLGRTLSQSNKTPLTIELTRASGTTTAEYDLVATATVKAGATTTPHPVADTKDALHKLFTAAGIDTTNPAVAAELSALATEFDAPITAPVTKPAQFMSGGGGSGTSTGPHPLSIITAIAALLTIYAAGVVVICRTHHRNAPAIPKPT